MDYEKAYKDALQLARSYYDKGTNEFARHFYELGLNARKEESK